MKKTNIIVCAAIAGAGIAAFYWSMDRESPETIENRREAKQIWLSPKGLAVRTECARKYGVDVPQPETLDIERKHHDPKDTVAWIRCSLRGLYPDSAYLLKDPDPSATAKAGPN